MNINYGYVLCITTWFNKRIEISLNDLNAK